MVHRKRGSRALLALLLLLGPGRVLAGMGPLEPNTNRQGEDFRGYAFRVVSAEDCRIACEQIDACKAMTFVRSGNASGDCWLKNKVPPKTPNSGMTSAEKRGSWKGEGGD